MNLQSAQILLKGLLERLMADAAGEKPQYGAVVSGSEREALDFLHRHLTAPTMAEHTVTAAIGTQSRFVPSQTNTQEDIPQSASDMPTARAYPIAP